MFSGRNIVFIFLIILLAAFISGFYNPSAAEKLQTEKGEPMILEEKNGDYTVRIDLSKQLLFLEVPEEKEYFYQEGKTEVETPIYPTLQELVAYNNFMSASIISAKAKQFDDGLYAAVEIAAQEGTGNFKGKKQFLLNVHRALKEISKADTDYSIAFIHSAASLGGQEFQDEEAIVKEAEKLKGEFLAEPLRSKPIGFYTWNEPLKQIFQQDRFLQSKLEDPLMITTGIVNSGEKDFYGKYLTLTEKLTNPLSKSMKDLRPLMAGEKPSPQDDYAFFPPSRAYETDLVKKLYGDSQIPDNFNLADKLIEEIKAGRIDLNPKENSGWYDYQTYSLESLVMPEKFPEGKKIEVGENYRKELLELFKSLLALARETHIKQLEIPTAGCCPPDEETPRPTINIYPGLSMEPLATYYLRRGQSYTFIHRVLLDVFGEEGLRKMHRYTSEGPVEKDLHQELTEMESLFYGAARLVASEIGAALEETSEGSANKEKDIQFVREWLDNFRNDPDIMKDNRMMVPVFYDADRKMTKVWVFLGYETKKLSVAYQSRPEVQVFDKNGKELRPEDMDIIFNDVTEEIIYPVFSEIYVKKILNREEFRALCDKYKTRSEIIEALQK